MKKILPILKILSKVLIGLVLLSVLAINLSMGYIMFAPDTFPKPFYLMYQNTGGNGTISVQESTSGSLNAIPTVEPTATPTPMPKPGDGIMLNTGTKIINLAEPNGNKYIRVTIVLEFAANDPSFPSMETEARTAYETTF